MKQDTNSATATIDNSIPANPPLDTGVDFGAGRYSTVMKFCFDGSIKVLGMTPKGAERFARNVGTQVGRAMKGVTYAEDIKIGRTGVKSGQLSISEALKGTAKKQESTPELQIAHALQWWSDAGKNGWSYSKRFPLLTEDLQMAVNAIELDSQ